MWGRAILRYAVFDKLLGSEMVIQVNFARYSVIKPRDGDKNLQLHEKIRRYNVNFR